jgi:hypothetical protein
MTVWIVIDRTGFSANSKRLIGRRHSSERRLRGTACLLIRLMHFNLGGRFDDVKAIQVVGSVFAFLATYRSSDRKNITLGDQAHDANA